MIVHDYRFRVHDYRFRVHYHALNVANSRAFRKALPFWADGVSVYFCDRNGTNSTVTATNLNTRAIKLLAIQLKERRCTVFISCEIFCVTDSC